MSRASYGPYDEARSTVSAVYMLIHRRDRPRVSEEDLNESCAIDMLFRNPYIRYDDLAESIGIPLPAAMRYSPNRSPNRDRRVQSGRSMGRVATASASRNA